MQVDDDADDYNVRLTHLTKRIQSYHQSHRWSNYSCKFARTCTGWKVLTFVLPGMGCGSVVRAVAFNSRGPQFESTDRQNFAITNIPLTVENTQINKKRLGMAHLNKHLPQLFPVTAERHQVGDLHAVEWGEGPRVLVIAIKATRTTAEEWVL